MDADQENVVSAAAPGSLCRGICTVLGAGVTSETMSMPLCAPLPSSCGRVFSSSGERVCSQWESWPFCALCGSHEACFHSVGKKGKEETLDCLVSPCYCCSRFSLSLAEFEINTKMCMKWRLSASSQCPGQYRNTIY